MKKSLLLSIGLLAAGAGVGALALSRREISRMRIEHKAIKLFPGMPAEVTVGERTAQLDTICRGDAGDLLEGSSRTLKILHLSDLHLTRRESPGKLDFLREVTDDDYDLIFLTGDIFQHDESVMYAPYLISRRPRLGAFAVLGNHDYYRYSMFHKTVGRIIPAYRHPSKATRDVERLVSALSSVGYEVLRDQSRYLADEGILIVGSDFPLIPQERLNELVSSVPESTLLLALFHLPRWLEVYEQAGVDMAFCGHTHGGQIRVPGFGALITDSDLGRREASGLTVRGNTLFHISRGLSADPRTNVRLFCPPEASVVELTYLSRKAPVKV